MRALFLGAFLFLFAAPAMASEQAKALLYQLGLDQYFANAAQARGGWPTDIAQQFQLNATRDWERELGGLFDPDAMLDHASEVLARSFTSEEIYAYAEAFAREDIAQILAREREVSDPDRYEATQAAIDSFAAGLDESFRQRFDLLDRSLWVLEYHRMEADNLVREFSVLYAGLREGGVLLQGLSDDDIISLASANHGTFVTHIHAFYIKYWAYTYQDISDDAFRSYVAFLSRPDIAQLSSALSLAIHEASIEDIRELGRRIGRLAGQQDL